MVFVNSNSQMQKKKLLTNSEILDILSAVKKKEIKEVFQIEEKMCFCFRLQKCVFLSNCFCPQRSPPVSHPFLLPGKYLQSVVCPLFSSAQEAYSKKLDEYLIS